MISFYFICAILFLFCAATLVINVYLLYLHLTRFNSIQEFVNFHAERLSNLLAEFCKYEKK